jgi:hypothetical protein
MNLKNLKNTWEESKKSELNKNVLTMEKLTDMLSTRTSSVTLKMKNGVILSMGLELLLIAGASNLLFFYSSDFTSLVTGLVIITILFVFFIFSFSQYRNIKLMENCKESVRDTLVKRINFFKIGYRWIVLSIALSGAFVYIIGSATYFNIKYGQIVMDSTDLLVHGTFLLIALVIGLVANTKEHNQYLNELEVSLADLDNREISPVTDPKKDNRRRRIWMILAGIGLMLLILMILYLFGL